MAIKPEDNAEDFTLSDQDSKQIRLSDFKGKMELNTVALGISVDTVPSKTRK